jgi:nuclear polyadenylated RNA-binding protein 3
MHFPASTNVPVLAMQMDLSCDKTEAHMSDPAMHNADVRPDFWRHLAEQQQQQEEAAGERMSGEHASPHSTGGDNDIDVGIEVQAEANSSDILPEQASAEEAATDAHPRPMSSITYAPTSAGNASDLLLPSDGARAEQVQCTSALSHSSVDVDALLSILHSNPVAADSDSPTVSASLYCPLVDLGSITTNSNSESSSGNRFGRGVRDGLPAPLLRI